MKYQKVIDQITSGLCTRVELDTLRVRAQTKLKEGDPEAHTVLQALDSAVAKDAGIVFMGFCPNRELANRLDKEWKRLGICTFDYDDDVKQMDAFRSICAGDLIVLKKGEQFGRTMSLHGHGRVTGTRTGADGRRYLEVTWSPAGELNQHVPMMGCQSTVNVREMRTVEASMPDEFFEWAGLPRTKRQSDGP